MSDLESHPDLRVAIGCSTWLGNFWVATRGALVSEVRFNLPPPVHEGDDTTGAEVARQIAAFLSGDIRAIEAPLDWSVLPTAHGAILRALYESVPWGDVVTYGELAAMAGHPGAARAAGAACRMNPFAIVAPAHRVIAAGGRLGGYGGRPDIKRLLLEREGNWKPGKRR
ncbi:MAG TPA: methylated-DNA--[protein]-cysteine S-methyltransferase [Armatimonadota bacterium]|jgi:methylated-DNA-[protein]-cysteine S-methyltransferase